jgi:hypothetical protein
MTVDVQRSIRRAAALVGLGLLVQLGAALHWTPGAFLAAAVVGVPLVLVGCLKFIAVVLRVMKNKGAL